MEDFQKILPVTKIKRNLLDIIKKMQEEDETIAVTRNGEAVGVLMNLSRYEALMETIEILADREVIKSLKQSTTDFETGRVIDGQDVWGD